jgi:hypothetical protein
MSDYAFNFQDKTFTPDGKIDIPLATTADHNRAVELAEIEAIKQGPERLFLYIGKKELNGRQTYCVQTWLGTWLGWTWLGPKRYIGFDRWTYRRAVTVRIFGTLYRGWYMDSSGDYCRLKRAKKQDGRYAATEVRA